MSDLGTGTYDRPTHGWTCFFCGETFQTPYLARMHFGADPLTAAACRIKAGDEWRLVCELRDEQAENERLRGQVEAGERRIADLDREIAKLAAPCQIEDCMYDVLTKRAEAATLALSDLRARGDALAGQLSAVIGQLNGQAYSSTLSALNYFKAALSQDPRPADKETRR